MSNYINKIPGSNALHVVIGNHDLISLFRYLSDKYNADPKDLIIEAIIDYYSDDIKDLNEKAGQL